MAKCKHTDSDKFEKREWSGTKQKWGYRSWKKCKSCGAVHSVKRAKYKDN